KYESAIVRSSSTSGRSPDVGPCGVGDDDDMSTPSSDGGLDVERLTGSIGAVVHGLDLSVPLAGRVVEHRYLIAKHQVVSAHNQRLEEDGDKTSAGQFGALSIHPVGELTGSSRAMSVIEDTPESVTRSAGRSSDGMEVARLGGGAGAVAGGDGVLPRVR